ncbi:alpha/beta-hydrolase [Pyrenophora tritici-repentis]|nr:alpha/beta-hydrolase [Pyrenophora tritici-repentis]KAI0606311.1 alpha/beta-hydrolase [Pyrenophora tritici-repentis]KAI0619502.1 alpha/beta-hydrolase [Pyrenophora tritici-repentis]
MLCEILASAYPDRVSSLTICASPTHLPRAAVELFTFGRVSWGAAVRELGSRGWAEELVRVPGTVPVPSYSDENADGEAAMENYLDMINVSDGEGLAQYAEFLEALDARPYLGAITCPMLILAPTGSVAVKVEEMQEVKEKIGERCKVVSVEGGGHEIYVTRAGVCQEAFLQFLEKTDGRGEA